MNFLSSLLTKSLSLPSLSFSLLLISIGLHFWNASDIPELIILPSSSILHTRFICLAPIWSLLCWPQTFNIFPLPANLIQALYPTSQVFSQPGPNLHFSSQHSEELKNFSLRINFTSHLVYLSIPCMNPSEHLN